MWWQFLEAITTEDMNDGCRVNICVGTLGSRCAGVDGLISQFLQPVTKKMEPSTEVMDENTQIMKQFLDFFYTS